MFAYIKEHAKYLCQANAVTSIDALRAIAVSMVMVSHFGTIIYRNMALQPKLNLFSLANQGVDLFFVLSGFLISGLLLQELKKTGTINFKKFYSRRFLRIFPLYFVTTAATFVVLSMQSPAPVNPFDQLKLLVENCFFLQTALSSSSNNWLALGSWSLCVEEWFYWLVPAVMLGIFAIRSTLRNAALPLSVLFLCSLIALRIATVVVHTQDINGWEAWYEASKPWCRFDELFLGIGAQLAVTRFRSRLVRITAAFAGLSLVSVPYVVIVMSAKGALPQWLLNACGAYMSMPTISALGFAFILLAVLSMRIHFTPITIMAKLSFPLYLWHCFAVKFFPYAGVKRALPLLIIESFGLAYVASLLVEYPFLRMYKGRKEQSQRAIQELETQRSTARQKDFATSANSD